MLVRNTFIDHPVEHLDSLEGFLHERQAFSCPVSRVSEPGSGIEGVPHLPPKAVSESAHDTHEKSTAAPQASEQHSQEAEESDCSTVDTGSIRNLPHTPEMEPAQPFQMMSLSGLLSAASSEVPDPHSTSASSSSQYFPVQGYTPFGALSCARPPSVPAPPSAPAPLVPPRVTPQAPAHAAQAPPQVLRLQDALGEPDTQNAQEVHHAVAVAAAQAVTASHEEQVAAANAFASASGLSLQKEPMPTELPSAGSGGHHLGQCRPCAFWTTKGCSSGKDCQFCHLCAPGEKKRRQKAKRAFFGALAEMQRCFSSAD